MGVQIDGQKWTDTDVGTSTKGEGAGRGDGKEFTHTFVASSSSAVLSFWAAKSNCFDIDDVSLTKARGGSFCTPSTTNLVQNGGFSGSTHWQSDTTNYLNSPGSNYGGHNHWGGWHVHGHCPNHWGGSKQTITGLEVGTTYELKYHGWGGSWDGDDNDNNRGRHDTDELLVQIDGQKWTDTDVGTSTKGEGAGRGDGKEFTHTFVASSSSAVLSFWAARSNCFDIDDVSLTKARGLCCRE